MKKILFLLMVLPFIAMAQNVDYLPVSMHKFYDFRLDSTETETRYFYFPKFGDVTQTDSTRDKFLHQTGFYNITVKIDSSSGYTVGDLDSLSVVVKELSADSLVIANDSLIIANNISWTRGSPLAFPLFLNGYGSGIQIKISRYCKNGTVDARVILSQSPSSNNLLSAKYNNSFVTGLVLDPITGSIVTIDKLNHEIHEGNHFSFTGDSTLGSGDSLIFIVNTPASPYQIHMTFDINSSKSMHVVVYRGTSYTGGTLVTAHNSDENSADTSFAVIATAPGTYTFGTGIDSSAVGTSGGNISREYKKILKYSTIYFYVIVSDEASNIINYAGTWYQIKPKYLP